MTTGDNPRKSFSIVGIGASAGGLGALQRFLAVLPQDFGFALVFIQHLSSKHKSLLSELLSARRPSLVIQQITDGLKIQPGRLYLAPPGREVRLRNGLFQTTAHPEGLIHLPIDEFLSSLAEDAAERSIAAIFSGAGTDGARGCQAIRSVGGTVFVQDPQTAEFDSMPLAAIATGQADAVLPPEGIAAELLKLQGIGQAAVHRELPVTPEEFDDFFRILQEKTGGRFNHYKKSVVGRRIRRRMYLHGVSAVKDYLDLISTSDPEAALLASDLMIGVTSFFRDRVAWKALNLEAIRKIAAEDDGLPVRVWTPASATGEEAYSIAMMLMRELALAGKKLDIQVFATDVNERALERAREGKYPASITSDVPQEYVQKYFTSSEDGNFLVINKDVRECVVFARQDLLTDPPFSKLDLIICRNFLIYLEPEAQEKSITLFHYALKEGGFLFLGNAETVGRKSVLFKSIGHKQCRIYRKLESKPASRLPISVPYASERAAQAPKQAQLAEQKQSFTEIIQEKLLEEYGPASVAIDQSCEIIYHNGPTNRYLRQPRGVPTQNLLELVPENLRSRIRGALYRASREEKTVSIRAGLPVASENPPQSPFAPSAKLRAGAGGSKEFPPLKKGGRGDLPPLRQVSLRVTKAAENLYIIVFHEKGAPSKEEAAEAVDSTVIEETAIHQLESELSATKADLQSHIEQLKSLNEELQSSNEELQAANEELETSREELQSLNEELVTVNSQLQGKIEEQDATNDDLNNFQASTNIPMIFLDTHFQVKRFTPAMLRLIKLLPSDAGRPIVDMSQENLGPDLTSDAQAVLESLVPARKELDISGASYIRTILPYRTSDNRIEGVVITYHDVTDLKRAEERTRHLASFPQLNPNPIIEVDASGKVIFANPGTESILESLGMDKGETSVFLPKDLNVILKDLDKNSDSSIYREIPVKDRVFGETIHLVPRFDAARIYAYDITERKMAEESLLRAKEEWERTFDSVPDLIAILDNQHRIRRVNEAMARKLGLEPGECIGKPCYEYVHGLSVPPDFCPHSRTIGDHCQHIEEVHEDRLGGDFVVSTTPLYDEKGQMTGSVHVSHDITQRKKAEEAQGRLSAIVENAEDAIISKDLNGVIQTWNVGAEKMFGYSAEEAIGKHVSFLVPPGHADEVPDILRRLSQGEHIEDFETVRMRKDGTIIPVSLNFSAIRDSNGKVIGASKIAHDITERKKAEEDLRASNEELTRFNNAAVGRELRMVELKKELNELRVRAGLPPRYSLESDEEQP
jgi:PAS domain S-box-containing protein